MCFVVTILKIVCGILLPKDPDGLLQAVATQICKKREEPKLMSYIFQFLRLVRVKYDILSRFRNKVASPGTDIAIRPKKSWFRR